MSQGHSFDWWWLIWEHPAHCGWCQPCFSCAGSLESVRNQTEHDMGSKPGFLVGFLQRSVLAPASSFGSWCFYHSNRKQARILRQSMMQFNLNQDSRFKASIWRYQNRSWLQKVWKQVFIPSRAISSHHSSSPTPYKMTDLHLIWQLKCQSLTEASTCLIYKSPSQRD